MDQELVLSLLDSNLYDDQSMVSESPLSIVTTIPTRPATHPSSTRPFSSSCVIASPIPHPHAPPINNLPILPTLSSIMPQPPMIPKPKF